MSTAFEKRLQRLEARAGGNGYRSGGSGGGGDGGNGGNRRLRLLRLQARLGLPIPDSCPKDILSEALRRLRQLRDDHSEDHENEFRAWVSTVVAQYDDPAAVSYRAWRDAVLRRFDE